MDWRKQWALEIADSKAGVGTEYQDGLADCIAEADDYIAQLEAELEGYRRANESAKKLHATVVEALAKSSMENARLRKRIQEIADKIEYDSLVDDIHSQLLDVIKEEEVEI